MSNSAADAESPVEREVKDRIDFFPKDLLRELLASFCDSGNYQAMIGKFSQQFVDQRPGGICLADRNAMQPDDLSIVLFEFRIVSKTLRKPRCVFLPIKQKCRQHKQKAERINDAVNKVHSQAETRAIARVSRRSLRSNDKSPKSLRPSAAGFGLSISKMNTLPNGRVSACGYFTLSI